MSGFMMYLFLRWVAVEIFAIPSTDKVLPFGSGGAALDGQQDILPSAGR
jgi:hypothetical protein